MFVWLACAWGGGVSFVPFRGLRQRMEVRLVVTNEKSNAKQVRLGPETVIGRSSECNLRIASGQVSRQHCLIRVEESRVLVRDLGSANGTELDGVAIPPEIDIPVAPGTTLVVGPLKFVFEFTPEPPKEVDGEENLQSTTEDIPPIPSHRLPKVTDEETKDYGPALGRQHRTLSVGEPDSGQIDFSEGEPNSPVALVGGERNVPSDGSSVEAAEETIFDRQLARRSGETEPVAFENARRLESGTDLLPEAVDDNVPSPPSGVGSAADDSGDGSDDPEDSSRETIEDNSSADAKHAGKGWKVFQMLKRRRKQDAENPGKLPPPPSVPEGGTANPPSVDPTAPPPSVEDDSALQDFFRRFEK